MQHDPSTDLIECLNGRHKHPTKENRRQHALEIIRNGRDIHSVTEYNRACLHPAIKEGFSDVVQLLLEKGIDVNAQNLFGNTALHVACYGGLDVQAQTELVPMLLYHGADPWIRNSSNYTPLDLIIKTGFYLISCYADFKKCKLVATIEHLYYYMFDQYTQFGLSVDALLKVADLDLPIFHEIVESINDDLTTTTDVDVEHILTMPSENLRLILDKFHYVFIPLFLSTDLKDNYDSWKEIRHENVYILLGSDLQREFIQWLCKWKLSHTFLDNLFTNPAPLTCREDIVYYLLSCGMEIDGGDIEIVYKCCGYTELFKLLRFMDVTPKSKKMKQLIPRLIFDVTGCIQKNIEDPEFWISNPFDLGFESVIPYYAVRNLKDLCCGLKGKEKLFRKLLGQPRIPLLVEMARNVFRRYFVQRLGIRSAKQFYESLELLPISPHHRKIIALETELY